MTRGPKYSTNSGIFAKRGDPWVSERQGLEDFGRVLATENPDFDAAVRAKRVEKKERYVDPKPPGKPKEDFARRKANIIATMRRELREAENNVVEVAATRHVFKPCTGCRKASCIAKGSCQVF